MLELLTQFLSLIQDVLVTPTVWLFPLKWVIVEPGEAAVRYTCGHPGPDLGEGVRFGTSTQVLIVEHVRTRIAPTTPIAILTKDGRPLQADAVLTYSVSSLSTFYAAAEEPDEHLAAVAEAAYRAAMSSRSFEDIVSDSVSLESEVRKQIAEAMAGCGIKVRKARFQNIEQLPDYVRMSKAGIVPVIDLNKQCVE